MNKVQAFKIMQESITNNTFDWNVIVEKLFKHKKDRFPVVEYGDQILTFEGKKQFARCEVVVETNELLSNKLNGEYFTDEDYINNIKVNDDRLSVYTKNIWRKVFVEVRLEAAGETYLTLNTWFAQRHKNLMEAAIGNMLMDIQKMPKLVDVRWHNQVDKAAKTNIAWLLVEISNKAEGETSNVLKEVAGMLSRVKVA